MAIAGQTLTGTGNAADQVRPGTSLRLVRRCTARGTFPNTVPRYIYQRDRTQEIAMAVQVPFSRLLLIIGKQTLQIPTALNRDSLAGQCRLGSSLLSCMGIGLRENRNGVVVQRGTFQKFAKFAPLLQDGHLPGSRPSIRLMFPLQKVGEQDDQTASHFSPISFGHFCQVLAQVRVIHLPVAALGSKVRHSFEPCRLVLLVQDTQWQQFGCRHGLSQVRAIEQQTFRIHHLPKREQNNNEQTNGTLILMTMGDGAILKLDGQIPAKPSELLSEEVLRAGFFDESWQLPDQR